ncbi:hypothetical protein ACP70R_023045 [Stipagrostis hirtigluma subsp. patula]
MRRRRAQETPACRDCPRDQMNSICCRGGLHRHAAPLQRQPDGGGEEYKDRITRAAAHTALLSRRWRGLWARLPELTFHNTELGPLHAALVRVALAHPALPTSFLGVEVPSHHSSLAPDRVSSWLRATARLSPATFFLRIWSAFATNSDAIELPSFVRATSIELLAPAGRFMLPPAGDFPVLESITLDCSHVEFGDLLPRCSHLRRLCFNSRDLSSITVHSLSLEELDVHSFKQLQRIDIKAPKLKKLRLNADRGISDEFSLSLSAPEVEELSWQCSCLPSTGMFGVSWRVDILNFTIEETIGHSQLTGNGGNACLQLQQRSRVHVLWLYILPMPVYFRADAAQGFRQKISRFLFTNFSVLELNIRTQGHVYGAMVLHLLGLCTSIQRLEVVNLRSSSEFKLCSFGCPCDQPNNWRSQIISLTELKEVEIKGFKGKGHEVDLLQILLRCAPMLERVTLRLSSIIGSVCRETLSIFQAYPSVECNVYRTPRNDFCRYD